MKKAVIVMMVVLFSGSGAFAKCANSYDGPLVGTTISSSSGSSGSGVNSK